MAPSVQQGSVTNRCSSCSTAFSPFSPAATCYQILQYLRAHFANVLVVLANLVVPQAVAELKPALLQQAAHALLPARHACQACFTLCKIPKMRGLAITFCQVHHCCLQPQTWLKSSANELGLLRLHQAADSLPVIEVTFEACLLQHSADRLHWLHKSFSPFSLLQLQALAVLTSSNWPLCKRPPVPCC